MTIASPGEWQSARSKDWDHNNYDTRSSRSNSVDRDNNLETGKLETLGITEKAPKMVATNGDDTAMPY